MKTSKSIFAILFLAALFFTGCSKDDDGTIVPEENNFIPPTAAEFEQLQEDALNSILQTASFNAEDGITFTSEKGVVLTIQPSCLSLNGNPVTGPVELKFTEIFDRGTMVATNRATVGEHPNGDKELLISGGQFNIRVMQNGQELSSECIIRLQVPTALTGGTDPDMGPFTGQVDAEGNIVWTLAQMEFGIDGASASYYAFMNEFGWFNCDRFADFPGPKTEVEVLIPQGFSQENSSVYYALVGEENTLGYLSGEIPVGLDVHIIFVSEDDGDFRYGIKSLTIEDGQQVTFSLEDTQVGTQAEMTQAIDALP